MPSYVVETYVPRSSSAELAATAERAREAALTLAAEGQRIRFLRSTFLPTDELCLLVFEADSPAVVGEATERAAIEFERVVEAIDDEGARAGPFGPPPSSSLTRRTEPHGRLNATAAHEIDPENRGGIR